MMPAFAWDKKLYADLEQMALELNDRVRPWKVPEAVFDVRDYGAKADGNTVNTLAIQQAIDTCSIAGGGTVLFASGDFVTGTIVLREGVMLQIDESACLLGSTSLADYPDMIEQFRSVLSDIYEFRKSLIYAERVRYVGIRGKGVIDFRGSSDNFPGIETTAKIEGRPLGIRMIECAEILVQDITLRNAAAWMQVYCACESLLFEGMTVFNHANWNNDGLDPDGCRNLIIRNCYINAEDDALCLKGASACVTENVLIENSTFLSTCNALKIGTDTQGAFRNILARNLHLGGIPSEEESSCGHEASTGITLTSVDGGDIEDVFIRDCTISRSRCPVFIRIGNRGRHIEGRKNPGPGTIRRILIEGITGTGNFRQGSLISGLPVHPVYDILIRNYEIEMSGGGTSDMASAQVPLNETGYSDAHKFSRDGLPSYGMYIRHARNVSLETVKIHPLECDARPEFALGDDVEWVLLAKRD